MVKIALVVPVYRETPKAIKDFIANMKEADPLIQIVMPCDDSASATLAKSLGAFVPYHDHKHGYGRSLKDGLLLAWFTLDCDIVIEMDLDHPLEYLSHFLSALSTPNTHMAIGYETGEWNLSRKGACWLTRTILKFDQKHPTCGYVAWKKQALQAIPWSLIKANDDGIHVELLWWAVKLHIPVAEVGFDNHGGERHYGWRRMARWLRTFLRLVRMSYVTGWREIYQP